MNLSTGATLLALAKSIYCILVRVQNSGIRGDFGLNWATCKPFERYAVCEQSVYNCYDFYGCFG